MRPRIDWLAAQGGISGGQLRHHTYVLEDRAAARHAFRVASGLDSMVLGEPQILGQMKQAVREADAAGTLGTTLHQLFQRSFSVAKEVRTSTEIGAHSHQHGRRRGAAGGAAVRGPGRDPACCSSAPAR